MDPFFQAVFSILNTDPGNLAYHMILAFSVVGALMSSVLSFRNYELHQGSRMVLGLGLLLAVRAILFVMAGLAWAGIDVSTIIAPLDRGASLFGVILIAWLWAFPIRSKPADSATLLVSLLSITFTALAAAWWSANGTPGTFNGSLPDLATSIFALLILLAGLIVLLLRKPEGRGIGTAALIILALGYLVHIIYPIENGDFAGVIRLAELAAYPMLLILPQRFSTLPQTDTSETVTASERADSALLDSLLSLLSEKSLEGICLSATRITAEHFQAELCLCVTAMEETEGAQISCGYNLITKQPIGQLPMEGGPAASIANAIRRGRPLRLPPSSSSKTPAGFLVKLGFTQSGGILAVPLAIAGRSTPWGLVLLSPVKETTWTGSDQDKLSQFAELTALVIEQSLNTKADPNQMILERARQEEIQVQSEEVNRQNEELRSELETLRQQHAGEHSRAENLASLLASRDESHEVIGQLEAEIKRLKDQAQADQPRSETEVAQELRKTLEELAALRRELDAAKGSPEKTPSEKGLAQEQVEVIASISQELRQPMSSIVGYTDLLLGESAGILGALQRKFLERIKASTERMGSLIDDLVQTSSSSSGKPSLTPTSVDLNAIIDDTIAVIMSQLREKNIVLRVDIPEALPPIVADRDGMQQILLHLLQNAGSATPSDGEISLHAAVQHEEGSQDYILLQVIDSGGGISTEDLPRVFSRLYRADNPLIQGLGETGVGLSIVKTLVEAHNGRIWVDSEAGLGSTFSVLLPVYKETRSGERGKEKRP